MELCANTVNDWTLLTMFAKSSTKDAWQGYAFEFLYKITSYKKLSVQSNKQYDVVLPTHNMGSARLFSQLSKTQ